MNKNVWLLFCCQALANAIMSGQTIMASLVGFKLAGNALNTLPMAIQMIAVMCASIVASHMFSRYGRKAGFWLGSGVSFCGSLIFALGIYTGNFPLYCLGAIPAGLGHGIGQHLRFAAAEVADPAARPRAISLVLAGGVLAAIVGPEMVKRTHDLIGGYEFLATYLYLPVLPMISATLLYFVALPPAPPRVVVKIPFREILARPNFVAAVCASLAGYASMNLLMVSTPLQMVICGFGVAATADVIRAHSVSMFAPGFFTGRLIQKFGVHQIIGIGSVITLSCVAINMSFAPLWGVFMVSLALLGLGWNFMFVGGTTMLTTAYTAQERVRVQATHDFIVFGSVAGTALSSGAIEAVWGWGALNLTVLPPVLIAMAVVAWHYVAKRQVVVSAV
jgi:MFS family permease